MAFRLRGHQLRGPEAAQPLSGARPPARRGTGSAGCQRASVGGGTQSVASIPMHRRRFMCYPVRSLFSLEAQSSRLFVCLLCLFFLPKGFKGASFVVVGLSIVGVQTDGLLISSEGFLIALEVVEGSALAIVGLSKVGVQADGLLIS